MKIVYYLEWNPFESSGVLNKVNSQVKEWRSHGHEVRIIFTHPIKPLSQDNDFSFYYSKWALKMPISFLKNYFNKKFTAKRIAKEIEAFKPDVVYFRQGIYHSGFKTILKCFPSIMELNTLDLDEMKLQSSLKQYIYKRGRKKLFNLVSGTVAVTNEISNSVPDFIKNKEVIANGINLSEFELTDKQAREGQYNLIFIGTPDQPWHGEEKIEIMAKQLPEFNFHIVGPVINSELSNVTEYGYQGKERIKEIYKQMDVGLGTLCLYKKNMEEACTLKVREYIAYNLPVILGYTDPDLEGVDFALKIGNYERNVADNIQNIKDFVLKSRELKVNREVVDSRLKEQKRLNFFKRVIHEN